MRHETPTAEAERLATLRSLAILDTDPEGAFDELTRAAAAVCGTSSSFLSLVDAERVWFKSRAGAIKFSEAPREMSLCAEVIRGDDVVEIPDVLAEPRFAAHATICVPHDIRFYAGAPIELSNGRKVGALCVIDATPRTLDGTQREVLRCLAHAAARALESRELLLSRHKLARSLATALEDLEGSRARLRRLYEATPAMLHSIDAEGRLVMVSDMWLDKLGYTRAAVIGRPSTDFLTEASRRHAQDHVLPEFFRIGQCENVAYDMVARDGTVLNVLMSAALERDADGRVARSLTVVEDITDRVRTERALRDSEARYRMLAHATSDIITQLDLDLNRRYVSPACRAMLGYEPEELTGQTPIATVHPEDLGMLSETLEALKTGRIAGDQVMVTNRMRHKRGHWVWVEAGLNLVRDPESGAPQHLICAIRDVGERRRISDELERARAAAERAAASKTEFVANMSHELRTPLTGILGIHDLLQRDPDLNLRHRRYVTLAHEAGQSLMAIINDVLDFSKIEAGQLTLESVPFDLRALVEASCDFVRQEAQKKSLLIEAHLSTELTLMGDPGRLRQILLNLIANAVKFTAGGLVWVEADYDAAAARLRLSVSDTGIGIASAQLGTIFERFQQADGSITRQYGGTGLGLAICKRLVELMGGNIEVRSVVGAGSTFTFDIPAEAVASAPPREAQPEPVAATSHRVLLVEDNRLNQTIIAEMLRHRGHGVTVAENGLDAIAIAMSAQPFDIILMDVQMPVLDGYSATRAIRDRQAAEARRRTPIIGLTANASEQDRDLCLRAGMDARVTKPIDWHNLFAMMDEMVGHGGDAGPPPPSERPAILDRDALDGLGEIIGPQRLAEMVRTFLGEVREHGPRLIGLDEAEVVSLVHGWVSTAGHLGFHELSAAAVDVEQDIRSGRGIVRVAELQRAILRALDAAHRSDSARAA